MKNVLLIALLFISFAASAQSTGDYSQMWNTSSAYYGTVTSSTIGSQIDTSAGATKYFTTSYWKKTTYDSARISPVRGNGIFSITFVSLKGGFVATASPTVVVTPEQSPNGIVWSAIPGQTAATVVPTSKTVAVNTSFNLSDVYNPYLRLKTVTTDTAAIQVFGVFKAR